MSYQLKTTSIGTGIHFNYVLDKKFKHNRITISFIHKLQRDTVTENAIVPYILRQGGVEYPDFLHLNQKLASLYGADLSADVSKFGEYQVLDVTVQGIDNRFALNREDVIEECSKLLCSILMKPLIGTTYLTDKILENEKQSLLDTIETEINDKRSYALSRCKEIMCTDSSVAIKKYGYADQVKKIGFAEIETAYKRIMKTSAIEIMFVGAGNPEKSINIFEQAFAKIERNPIPFVSAMTFLGDVTTEKNVVEKMEISQSKLVMGFRVGKLDNEKQLASIRLLVALYGGTASSKLFKNVREKLSLCYYCVARLDKLTGIMMVDCGVEEANKTIAQNEILNQLELCKQGSISDEEITETKLAMKNGLGSVGDSMGSMEDWYMSQIMCGTQFEPAEEIEKLDSITKDDLVEASKAIALDTMFFLTTKDHE